MEDKKFIEILPTNDWEVLTDTGWKSINGIGKTIPYSVWELKTEDYYLECADTHIVFDSSYREVYVKDLTPGDTIITELGVQWVTLCRDTGVMKEMYDMEVDDENHRYWTSGILSHNTLWMGNLAAQAIKAVNNVAIITLELSDRKYLKRIGSNLLDIKISDYNRAAEDPEFIKKKMRNLAFDNMATPGQLHIQEFGTSQASVLDVEKWLRKVEEVKGIKFKIVVIDYINIMKNWRNPNSENTYMKVKQLAEDLRSMAQRNHWAVITASQTKQSEFDATDMSMNSASESSGLVATVDAMFGIIQDPVMYTNNEYKLKVLANRDEGYKNAYRKFNVDYSHMRITEDLDSQIINE